MPFRDRVDAGRQLAAALSRYRGKAPVVLALPRGGVPIGAEIAAALNAPLDLIMVRKIGVPDQPELAMGAIVDGGPPVIVRNEDVIGAVAVSEEEFEAVCRAELDEIERRRRRYLGARTPHPLARSTAILVDDGVATGATMRAAIRATRQRLPQTLVLAIPVAPSAALKELRHEVDDLVCLESHQIFGSIGAYYDDFTQVTDETVIALLAANAAAIKPG